MGASRRKNVLAKTDNADAPSAPVNAVRHVAAKRNQHTRRLLIQRRRNIVAKTRGVAVNRS